MRRSLIGMVVAAATALVPLLALAGNQEVAEQVAKALRASGQLHDYKIGVKYQEGMAWLKGQVTSEEQAKTALTLASQVPGVTRVRNELTVAAPGPASAEPAAGSRIQFGRENPASARLQAAGGAFAPEQVSRVAPTSAGGGWAAGTLDASSMQRLQNAQQPAPAQPAAGTRGQLGRENPGSARLQSTGGAFAPEQISRVAPASAGGGWAAGTLDASSMQRLQDAQQAGAAQPVATSFTQVPASPVMATEGRSAVAKASVPTQAQANTARSLRPVPMPVAYAPASAAVEQAAGTSASPSPMVAMVNAPIAMAGAPIAMAGAMMPGNGAAAAAYAGAPYGSAVAPARYDQPNMPCHAWPSYASYPNYAAVTYPRQYSPTAWPYIGPFYPYPQVPLGWRKVTLEWDDGWWMLDFKDK